MRSETSALSFGAGDDIRRRALSGLFWAMLQNWSGKGLSFVLFLVLARLLTPAQLGVAAAVSIVTVFASLIAEQGFSDAIVQRRDLSAADANLPFYSAFGASLLLAMIVVLLSSQFEHWLNVPGLAPLLSAAAATLPLAALSMFQEAFYRRHLLFKQVALRMLVTSTIAGVVAVGCAYAGMGSWSLIVQALVMNALNVVWLWHKPMWRPGTELRVDSYKQIVGFSGSVLASRVLDIVGTRSIEVLLVGLHGPAALGLYAVGSKVLQTLMQLLSAAVTNVSLGALSRMSHDLERMRRAFLQTLAASSALAMPVFVAGAAVAPEFVSVAFGRKWEASAPVMQVLMLLGALQCVQFVNGPTFSALGRPHYLAWMAFLKASAAVVALLAVPTRDVVQLTVVYAISQLVTTPLTYVWLMRCLGLRLATIAREVLPFYVAAALAYVAVHLAREWLAAEVPSMPAPALLVSLAVVFALTYALAALLLGLQQVRRIRTIFRK
jgi:O-antigen/teichoic acid export membrane protein